MDEAEETGNQGGAGGTPEGALPRYERQFRWHVKVSLGPLSAHWDAVYGIRGLVFSSTTRSCVLFDIA